MSVTSSLADSPTTHLVQDSPAPPPASSSVAPMETAGPRNDASIALTLSRIVRATGKKPLAVIREFGSLAFGPGRLSWSDYVNLRLFDDAFYAAAEKRSVVGQSRNRRIAQVINFRHDWFGLVANKVAARSYLAAYGFPTIPLKAIYAPGLEGSRTALRNSDDLHRFLMDDANYPIFGKPPEGYRSFGSIALEAARPETGMLVRRDGREIDAREFVAEIERHYPEGYLFQPYVKPDPAVAAMCGDRLATLRIVTLRGDSDPTIFRVCWKIPAAGNFADNYWRAGNLLGTIDEQTGCLSRVTSGFGVGLAEVTHHPDTGATLVGATVPGLDGAKALAIEGARLMRQAPLIGWDIAVTENGPLIVELNTNYPDLFLNQLADRRGVLDRQLLDCITIQKRNRRSYVRERKALMRG